MTTTPLAPFTKSMFLAFAGVESSNPQFATADDTDGNVLTLILDGTTVEAHVTNPDGDETVWSKHYPEGEATAECVALSLLCHAEQSANGAELEAVLERFAFQPF